MKLPGNLILVGMMGAGKTTVGRALARLTGKEFFDSDHEIEARTGVRIPTIFELEGEPGFRARECATIAELVAMDNIVLATGGGAVMNPENRRVLKSHGLVVYLRATVDELYLRTAHDKNRPLLQTANPREKIRELFVARDPLYREVADVVIDTGRQSINQLAQQLISKLEQHAHRQA
ncbi:shikimate kinase [Chitinibacteraceae bacterium HSL-7]